MPSAILLGVRSAPVSVRPLAAEMAIYPNRPRDTFELRVTIVAVVVALSACAVVYGQVCAGNVTVDPSSPTTATPVYVQFDGPGTDDGCQLTTVEVIGNEVRVETHFSCLIGSFYSTRRQFVGILPPGSYSVVVHDQDIDTYSCGSFSVAAVSSVPTLSGSFQLVLVVSLAALALFVGRTYPNGS